jgi:hypothetical protein
MNHNDQKVDVKENALITLDPKLLGLLLQDKTTRQNIIWATDDYLSLGQDYATDRQITVEAITGTNGNVIRPRIEKTKDEQTLRVKSKAEVFTPSWVCNRQNNLVDAAWFGREGVFNTEKLQSRMIGILLCNLGKHIIYRAIVVFNVLGHISVMLEPGFFFLGQIY